MPEQDAFNALNRSEVNPTPTATDRARVAAARAAVAARTPRSADERGLVSGPPPALSRFEAELRAAMPDRFGNGTRLVVADLRGIRAMQPFVDSNAAAVRVEGVDPDDLVAIARISVPLGGPRNLRTSFDQGRNSLVVSSKNPNLRFTGVVAGPAPNGQAGTLLGMTVDVVPSQMNVVCFGGRTVLRDGYHRAFGFLSSGINLVPLLYREVHQIEDVVLQGMLPQDAYLGSRPAMLPDYLDDEVSAAVTRPVSTKVIVVHGMELSPQG